MGVHVVAKTFKSRFIIAFYSMALLEPAHLMAVQNPDPGRSDGLCAASLTGDLMVMQPGTPGDFEFPAQWPESTDSC